MLSSIETGVYAGLGALGAAGLACGGFAYAALWPGSQIFGKTLTAPRKRGELALTFDDGPNPAWTPQLLDVLAKHGVKATFFMVGSFAEAEPELVRRVAEAGHLIGNHSWSHPNLALTAARKVTGRRGACAGSRAAGTTTDGSDQTASKTISGGR